MYDERLEGLDMFTSLMSTGGSVILFDIIEYIMAFSDVLEIVVYSLTISRRLMVYEFDFCCF